VVEEAVPQRDWEDDHPIIAARDIQADVIIGYRFMPEDLRDRGINRVAQLVFRERVRAVFAQKPL
jgi:hypothetical protein